MIRHIHIYLRPRDAATVGYEPAKHPRGKGGRFFGSGETTTSEPIEQKRERKALTVSLGGPPKRDKKRKVRASASRSTRRGRK